MITCGWCGRNYPVWSSQCEGCGGSLPLPPDMDPGSEPPAAPRVFPPGFERSTKWSGNVASLVGLVFFLVGSLLTTVMVITGNVLIALFPLLFVISGLGFLFYGRMRATRTLTAFRDGIAVRGSIVSVETDTSQVINGKNPWSVTYDFPVDNERTKSTQTCFDASVLRLKHGQPIWVLYMSSDPRQSTLYPPLS